MTTVRHLFVIATAMTLGAGCSHFDLRKPIPWGKGEDGELERPLKVVAMWKDTVMTHATGTATRGFGGRLMFYADEEGKPIKVKGSLVVYAFDETGRDPGNVVPDRKYVFSAEEFEEHYSKSPLGHSYSVWLPWDGAGGLQTEISLLVRFTTKEGAVVVNEQSTHVLPGAPNPNMNKQNVVRGARTAAAPQMAANTGPANAAATGVQPASHQAPIAGNPALPTTNNGAQAGQPWTNPTVQQMTTTTIPMTNRLGNRLPVAATTSQAAPLVGAAPNVAAGHSANVSHSPQMSVEQLSARFAPGRSRPLGAPIAQLSRDRGPWRPPHVGWPSGSGAQPQSALASGSTSPSGSAPPGQP
jgi:hypothetical protein